MSKQVLISVSSILALLTSEGASPETLAIVSEALGAEVSAPVAGAEVVQLHQDKAPTAFVAPVARGVSADQLAEFLVSDPRFTARSQKSIADHFGISLQDVEAIVSGAADRFTSRTSTRGLGVLVEEAA